MQKVKSTFKARQTTLTIEMWQSRQNIGTKTRQRKLLSIRKWTKCMIAWISRPQLALHSNRLAQSLHCTTACHSGSKSCQVVRLCKPLRPQHAQICSQSKCPQFLFKRYKSLLGQSIVPWRYGRNHLFQIRVHTSRYVLHQMII